MAVTSATDCQSSAASCPPYLRPFVTPKEKHPETNQEVKLVIVGEHRRVTEKGGGKSQCHAAVVRFPFPLCSATVCTPQRVCTDSGIVGIKLNQPQINKEEAKMNGTLSRFWTSGGHKWVYDSTEGHRSDTLLFWVLFGFSWRLFVSASALNY